MKGCSVGLTEAATLALHAAIFIANAPSGHASGREMAEALHVSEAHLAKVLNRLAREGLLNSTRGPAGGYALAREPKEIRLLDVYEALEGELQPGRCLWEAPKCGRASCPLGDLMYEVNQRVRDFLASTTLAHPGLSF